MSLSYGLRFMGMGMSSSYSSKIVSSTKAIISQSVSKSTVIPCGTTGDQATSGSGYGLYQWVIESGDGMDSVSHSNFICKMGPGFREAPQCPPEACIGPQC